MVHNPVIFSMLDNDLYKFTMQQAVLELFPSVKVSYRFKNRGIHKFPDSFVRLLNDEIAAMATLRLTQDELAYLQTIPFFKPAYLAYLSTYRFNPGEVRVRMEEGELCIDIKGSWYSTILWEVPLMAVISELYFREVEKEWSGHAYIGAFDKAERLDAAEIKFADFGTRRRRSCSIQGDVIRGLLQGSARNNGFVGTSNVHFAMAYHLKPIGTMAHEWIMGTSVLEGLRHANYYALQNWVRVYSADLGIALTDTFGLKSFLYNFNLRLAKLYDGVRHDSGDPYHFGEEIIAHYKKLGIDPQTKTIVFSDGLDVDKAVSIYRTFKGKIKMSFGIGTHFTNDFPGSPALNMVIKMWSCDGAPVVKLSDTDGKVMGDEDAVRVAKWTFFGTPLDEK